MPSFTGFAPTPDLAGAYLGGVAASQRAAEAQMQNQMGYAKLAQDAQQASAQIAMNQQKLQQEAEQSQMAMQVKQQQVQQNARLEEQKLRIQQQYETAQLGLKKQQLDQAEQTIQLKTKQAAQQALAQMEYRSRLSRGEDPQKVAQEMGPSMGLNGSAMGSLLRKPAAGLPPAMLENVGGDTTGRFKTIQTSATGRQVFDTQGSSLSKQRFEAGQENTRFNALRRDRQNLQKLQNDPTIALIIANVKSNPKEAGTTSKQVYEDYKARAAQISELEKQLPEYQPKSRFKEGQKITNNKTGETYVVVNGEPVLEDQADEAAPEESGNPDDYNPDEAQ